MYRDKQMALPRENLSLAPRNFGEAFMTDIAFKTIPEIRASDMSYMYFSQSDYLAISATLKNNIGCRKVNFLLKKMPIL